MEEVVDQFEAVGDDGRRYTVITYQTMKQFRTLSGTSTVPGLKRHALANGSHVNEMNDGTFQILDSDVRLRKL